MPAPSRLKVFLAAAIPFGAVAMVGLAMTLSRAGRYPALYTIVGPGIVLGALLGGLMLWEHDRASQRLTKQGIEPGDMAPVQERSVEVVGDFETIRAACRRALLQLPKSKLLSDDPITGDLEATTGMTWNRFAAKVLVRIAGDGDCATVHVTSAPRLSTATVDAGSTENVELFLRYLLSEVPAAAPNNRWRGP